VGSGGAPVCSQGCQPLVAGSHGFRIPSNSRASEGWWNRRNLREAVMRNPDALQGSSKIPTPSRGWHPWLHSGAPPEPGGGCLEPASAPAYRPAKVQTAQRFFQRLSDSYFGPAIFILALLFFQRLSDSYSGPAILPMAQRSLFRLCDSSNDPAILILTPRFFQRASDPYFGLAMLMFTQRFLFWLSEESQRRCALRHGALHSLQTMGRSRSVISRSLSWIRRRTGSGLSISRASRNQTAAFLASPDRAWSSPRVTGRG
jgi:hypothetical protein